MSPTPAVRGDSLALETTGSTTSYDLNAITRLEINRGQRSQTLLGAGAGLGALIGG